MIILEGNCSFSSNNLSGGPGGSPQAVGGTTAGSDIFIKTGSSVSFAPAAGQTISLTGSIADDSSTSVPGGNGVTPGSGTGGVIIKNGLGTLMLQGISSYIGGTKLNSGLLTVTGKIVGPLNSTPGSILNGTGSVGNVTLGGTLSPGDNTIGTLTMSSINFLSGSILAIELDPTHSSLAQVTGAATISGPTTILVTEDPGTYSLNTRYKVLEASSPISGVNFLSVQSANPKSRFLIDNSILTEIDLIRVTTMINTALLNGNRLILADYLNTLQDYGPLQPLLLDLNSLSQNELESALDTIDPARNAFAVFAAQNVAFTFNDIVSSRLNDIRFLTTSERRCCPCQEAGCGCDTGWISGFGEFTSLKSQRQTPSFTIGTGGVMLGYDIPVSDDCLMGLSVGYANINVHQDKHFGKQTVQDVSVSLYGTLLCDNLFLNLIVEGAVQNISSKRNIFFPGFNATARSHFRSSQLTPHIGFGFDIETCSCLLEPFANFDWAFNWTDSFTEKDATPLNFKQKLHDSSLLRSEAGISCFKLFSLECDGSLSLKGKISYVSLVPFNVGKVTAAIACAGGRFTVNSLTSNINLVSPGIEALYLHPSGFFASLNYDGEYGQHFSTSNVFLTLGKNF